MFPFQVAYECEYCHKMFITPAQLTAHRWHHTKPFWCQHCNMRFAAKGNLVVHLRRYSAKLGHRTAKLFGPEII